MGDRTASAMSVAQRALREAYEDGWHTGYDAAVSRLNRAIHGGKISPPDFTCSRMGGFVGEVTSEILRAEADNGDCRTPEDVQEGAGSSPALGEVGT